MPWSDYILQNRLEESTITHNDNTIIELIHDHHRAVDYCGSDDDENTTSD